MPGHLSFLWGKRKRIFFIKIAYFSIGGGEWARMESVHMID